MPFDETVTGAPFLIFRLRASAGESQTSRSGRWNCSSGVRSTAMPENKGRYATRRRPFVRAWDDVARLVGGTAETSRAPFDLPEADTELVAGYHTEYSGMRWGIFQAAEYINLLVLSGLCVTLFFGGYHFPWVHSLDILGPIWFVLKLFTLVAVFIWLRATQPRLRYDQLMRFGWKVLLPVATVNALITAALVVAVK